MNRKDFLKKTIYGSTAAFILPSFIQSCEKDAETSPIVTGKKIVIIGAGIAGLAAAKRFADRGINVTVLESQSKAGGRVRTDNSLGFAFDGGASWIHGPSGNPITNLAALSGATTFVTNDDSLSVFDINGTRYADATLDNAYSSYEAALSTVKNSGTNTSSFQSVFNSRFPANNSRLWNYMLSAYLEFDTGADIAALSSNEFDDDENFNGEDVIITNGYDKITQYLSLGINIIFNEKVSSINYNGASISITTNTKNYEADYVLITVPLGVLKNNVINFSPALPANKLQAITNLKMGAVNKFLLLFPSVFWDNNIQYIGYTPGTKGKFNYFLNMRKFIPQNALMTFAFGDYSVATESMSDSQITTEIMAHLKSIYGSGIPNPTNMLRTKWASNSNSFGAYSFATTGTTTKDFDTLAIAVGNKLFFAGEHTSKDYRGTVHGAYLSGVREADKVIALL